MTSPRSDSISNPVVISKKTRYLSTGLQVASGIIGMGAGFIYYAPGLGCAQSDICGKWLANLTSEPVAHGTFFLSGGLDFGFINGYFSADSIPRTIKYIQKQPSTKARIAKGTTIAVLTTSQTVQLLIACIGTDAKLWQTAVTVAGGLPGALYGTVGMMESEFPYVLNKLKYLVKELNYHTLARYFPLSQEEELIHRRNKYYTQQLQKTITKARENWKQITLAARNLEITEEDKHNALGFLLKNHDAHPATSCDKAIKISGAVIGLGLMANFTIPFQLNTLHVLQKQTAIPYLPLQMGLTGFLTASQVYGNIKITVGGVTAFLEIMKDLATGQAINSLPFRLRPKLTSVVFGICMLMSSMSYSVANLITTKDYDGPEKELFRDGAMLGIICFHLTGLLHLYEILLNRLTSNKNEQFIFSVHQELENLERLPLSDYIEKIEAPDNTFKNTIGADVFAAPDIEQNEDLIALPHDKVVNEEDEPSKKSWSNSWCCFNRPKRHVLINDGEHKENLLSPSNRNTL